ncbi:putative branched-chain-amino-acid aminotransferase [Aquimixticola soesokkakensis]|uniref:Probable branched-chain-amino-acid aminotransferase n=1 Tax=Aquimixticola soesokkakensis TaxID=1519096 RepID=A0A1Y5S3P3_9RHOB|nr:aminotransferase class IV family protein [Aquimixticola soesokkakensis]SLN32019.1 putative branched-chain-amino-acid aminotransferase [Aquimixticola soesokkakensis]
MRALQLIETLRFDPALGPAGAIVRRARHVARLQRSAAHLGFACDPDQVAAALDTVSSAQPLRLRLTLATTGALGLTTAPLTDIDRPWRVALSPRRLDKNDPMLRVKTTARALYDQTRAALPQGIDEVIFANDDGAVCEGTITNIFLRHGGILLTPPLSCGLLPGILREDLLAQGLAREAVLSARDLCGAEVLVGNSLRGLIACTPPSAADLRL